MKRYVILLLALISVGIMLGNGSKTEAATTAVPVYRLYNKSTQEHLFTTSKNEYDTLPDYGWKQEGCAWVSPKTGKGVYRLYNPKTKDHHYTADTNECKVLTTQYGWRYDNNQKPLFYSGGTIPVYRLYKKSLKVGSHHFTQDKNEYKVLPSYGWKQEGIAFYAVKHEHKWVAITEEEPVYEWVDVCNGCGVIFSGCTGYRAYTDKEWKDHLSNYDPPIPVVTERRWVGYDPEKTTEDRMVGIYKTVTYEKEWFAIKNGCGYYPPMTTTQARNHIKDHVWAGENGSTSTLTIRTGTETVIVGYKCSDCGAVK